MRYLYQQLLAFGTVILVVMSIIGFSFNQLMRNSMEESNYQQLGSYQQAFVNMNDKLKTIYANANIDNDNIIEEAIETMKAVFSSQNVDFIFIKNDGTLLPYSENFSEAELKLTEEEWQQLSDVDNMTTLKKTIGTNLYGKKEKTSYVISPASLTTADKKNTEFYGILVIAQPTKALDQSIQSMTSSMVKGFIVSFIIALIVSYYVVQIQLRRINSMKVATKQVAAGNFDIQLPDRGKDEFDELADSFNTMTNSLRESHEEIDRQEERRKQFMADASHEMRTPLTTIKGLLEGLQHNAIPENQKDNAIKLMQNETERLIRLVNENLDYEKIRTNQISILVKKLNGTQILQRLVTQLSAKAEAANNQLELLTTNDVEVYADYDRFVQIMVNILQNSLQFTKDGKITITIEKGYLETIVTITDTGIGMDEEQLRNIWERYYKADPSRKNTKYGESGLGLSIVHQLVKLHKGTINVESELGQGTTFRVSFPDVENSDERQDGAVKKNAVEDAGGQAASDQRKALQAAAEETDQAIEAQDLAGEPDEATEAVETGAAVAEMSSEKAEEAVKGAEATDDEAQATAKEQPKNKLDQ